MRALPPRPQSGWGWLAYAAVCLFWGTSGPLLRFTVRYVTPLWLVTIRFMIAGTVLWLGLSLLGRRPSVGSLPKLVPVGGALAVTNVLVTLGFERVDAGAGTLMLATTAVAFAVVDACWPGGTSKPSVSVWLGLLLGLLGVAVLVVSPGSFEGGTWQGYLMLELSAWTWALTSVAQTRYPSGLDPLQSSAWQMLVAAILVWPVAVAVGGTQIRAIAVEGWLGVAALVVTASLVAFVAFVYVLRVLPAFVVGSYTYVNAIVAATVGVAWLGEQLSMRYYLSAIFVLGGVALIQRRGYRGSGATQ
jgi:drug/metabolite transporter (DMT)-like permease